MPKIAILTDSNSGITQIEADALGVKVIPMPFLCNNRTYFEDVSLTQEEFYRLLSEGVDVSTSQPAIGEVCALWEELLKEYDEIVEIPMSSGLSMACDTATIFSQEKEFNGRVHIINNMRISVTQRQAVLDALNLVNQGKTGLEIKNILESDALNSSIYIAVENLNYLKKGGRVTPAAAMLGSILGIKPVLQIQGKKLDAFKKVRGIKAAKIAMINAIKDDILNRFGGDNSKVHICIAHTNNEVGALEFLEEVKKAIPNAKDYFVDSLSLSVSCHIGPGALGIAVIKDLEI